MGFHGKMATVQGNAPANSLKLVEIAMLKNIEEFSKSLKKNEAKISSEAARGSCSHKKPIAVWYATEYLINLAIHVPDIVAYSLRVHPRYLHFATSVHGENYQFKLNFFGAVAPEFTSHEIRGLNVIIRLVKSVCGTWPRLQASEQNLHWLKYNFDAEDLQNPDEFFDEYKGQKFEYNADSEYDDYENSDKVNDFVTFNEHKRKYGAYDEDLMD